MRKERALPEEKARQYHRLRNLEEYTTTVGRSKPGAMPDGAILAGGASRRMGRDKLFLRFGARTALERVSEAMTPLVGRLRVVGRAPSAGLPEAQPDLYPGLGPLAGVHAALEGLWPRDIELRIVPGTERHTGRQARTNLDWADVVLVWAKTELDHKVSLLYTKERLPKVVVAPRRGIEALADRLTEHLDPR